MQDNSSVARSQHGFVAGIWNDWIVAPLEFGGRCIYRAFCNSRLVAAMSAAVLIAGLVLPGLVYAHPEWSAERQALLNVIFFCLWPIGLAFVVIVARLLISPFLVYDDLKREHASFILELRRTHSVALIEAREELVATAQIDAIREQTAAQKAHTAELIRQFDEQARENSPITKAFRAVEEKEARTKMGLEPESVEYLQSVWLDALRREYIFSHDHVPPAIIAGTELPPTDWLNKRILELNEAFREQGKSFRLPLMK